MDPTGSRRAWRRIGRAWRRLTPVLGLLVALAPAPALADEVLGEQARAALDAVRARTAGCDGSPVSLASAGPSAGVLTQRAPLRWNARLAQAAARHAGAMARTRQFDHVGTDGTTVRDRVDATGYRWRLIAENLAAGPARIDGAIAGWLASAEHCAALLDGRFTDFGIARIESDGANDPYGVYWTLVLGRPR
jgi:hypothetical protein